MSALVVTQLRQCIRTEPGQSGASRTVAYPPASTFMEVGLAKPEFLVEIDVVGVISRD